jgi:hypothetical protein
LWVKRDSFVNLLDEDEKRVVYRSSVCRVRIYFDFALTVSGVWHVSDN